MKLKSTIKIDNRRINNDLLKIQWIRIKVITVLIVLKEVIEDCSRIIEAECAVQVQQIILTIIKDLVEVEE